MVFFFKGYLSNEFPSPFNGGSTVRHCLMEWEEFGRKRACLLICGWFEEESTEPITVVDVSAWSRLTAIEINTTTFFFSLQMLGMQLQSFLSKTIYLLDACIPRSESQSRGQRVGAGTASSQHIGSAGRCRLLLTVRSRYGFLSISVSAK